MDREIFSWFTGGGATIRQLEDGMCEVVISFNVS
jgi:hypothetical protein